MDVWQVQYIDRHASSTSDQDAYSQSKGTFLRDHGEHHCRIVETICARQHRGSAWVDGRRSVLSRNANGVCT